MSRLWEFIRGQEPAAVAGVLVAGLLAAGTFGLPVTEQQAKSLGVFATLILALVVRQAVASPATVVRVVAEAARDTAATLTEGAAGTVGEVTATAEGIVAHVTRDVAAPVVGAPAGLVDRVLGRLFR